MESAVAFYEHVARDAELREKLRELGSNEKVELYIKDELGYDFTEKEMRKVVFERYPEITDKDLEAVVGGILLPTPRPEPSDPPFYYP